MMMGYASSNCKKGASRNQDTRNTDAAKIPNWEVELKLSMCDLCESTIRGKQLTDISPNNAVHPQNID